jgi:hypothetical protein
LRKSVCNGGVGRAKVENADDGDCSSEKGNRALIQTYNYNLDCNSFCRVSRSSFEICSCTGHSITRPSLSPSEGFGMTWKWTCLTT